MFSSKITSQICRTIRYVKIKKTNNVLSSIFSVQNISSNRFSLLSFVSPKEDDHCKVSNYQVNVRNYAKGKDKKKEKGKGKIEINENQIAELVNLESLKTQMQKAITHLEEDFVKNLSLRSTTGAVESVVVNLDGSEHTLQELAQIVRKNPKTMVLNFATFPQAIPAALKAIAKSGMNLHPQQDGTTLYIPIPIVTKEHREQLSKNAKQLFVKCRDMVRDVQQKYIKQIKNKDKVSEDLARSVEHQIIAIADKFIAEAENILHKKQNELVGDK